VLIDGHPANRVAATDRGLQYGDGLFETAAVVDGRPTLWERHLQRLAEGCRRLNIPPPDTHRLTRESETLSAPLERGVLKVIVTRGSGGRGYRPPEAVRPTRMVSAHPYPEYSSVWWRNGVAVRVCRTRLGDQPSLAGVKHLNRLEQVLARSEWTDPEIAEGLMLSQNGTVVEGTVSNLFIVKEGRLSTPALERAGVAGIMRAQVMELAQEQGLAVDTRDIPLEAVFRADGAFLTNAVVGIWPIRLLRDRELPASACVRRLQTLLAERGLVPLPAGAS